MYIFVFKSKKFMQCVLKFLLIEIKLNVYFLNLRVFIIVDSDI